MTLPRVTTLLCSLRDCRACKGLWRKVLFGKIRGRYQDSRVKEDALRASCLQGIALVKVATELKRASQMNLEQRYATVLLPAPSHGAMLIIRELHDPNVKEGKRGNASGKEPAAFCIICYRMFTLETVQLIWISA